MSMHYSDVRLIMMSRLQRDMAHLFCNSASRATSPCPFVVWTLDPTHKEVKGLGKSLARKCLNWALECCWCWWGKELTSVQPTIVTFWLMTGSKYTVEHRNFENQSSTWPIAWKIWKKKFVEFRNCGISARYLWPRLFPGPFLAGWVWGPDYSP